MYVNAKLVFGKMNAGLITAFYCFCTTYYILCFDLLLLCCYCKFQKKVSVVSVCSFFFFFLNMLKVTCAHLYVAKENIHLFVLVVTIYYVSGLSCSLEFSLRFCFKDIVLK